MHGQAEPSDRAIKQFLQHTMSLGGSSIPWRVTGLHALLAFHERFLQDRSRRIHEFKEKLRDSRYALDAIISFYTAHVNGVINIINGAIDLGVAMNSPVAAHMPGAHIPHIPKIPYRGEYGAKYGRTMETGVEAGVIILTGGAAAEVVGGVGETALAGVNDLTVGGVRVGPGLVVATKASMVGLAVRDVYKTAQLARADIEVLSSDTASSAEKEAAFNHLVLLVAGTVAAAGAGSRRLPPGERPAMPSARTVRGAEEAEELGARASSETRSPAARGTDHNAHDWKRHLGENEPEVGAVNEAHAERMGFPSGAPEHHVFPRQYRAWFEERGFTGEYDIDNYVVTLDKAHHDAIHAGPKDPMWEWNSKVMDHLKQTERELGRRLTREEVLETVEQLMGRYGIPKEYRRWRGATGGRK